MSVCSKFRSNRYFHVYIQISSIARLLFIRHTLTQCQLLSEHYHFLQIILHCIVPIVLRAIFWILQRRRLIYWLAQVPVHASLSELALVLCVVLLHICWYPNWGSRVEELRFTLILVMVYVARVVADLRLRPQQNRPLPLLIRISKWEVRNVLFQRHLS